MKHLSYILILFFSFSAQAGKAQKTFEYPSLSVVNEDKINSPVLEFSPSFFEDGILFISTMSPGGEYNGYDEKIKKPTMSIFLGKRNEETGLLERPVPFALELTTKMHEGPLTFDRNAEKVYYTRNDLKKVKNKIAKLKIYESVKSPEGHWSLPVELPFNLDDFDTAHPTISTDGNTLIFSSNRPGGQGGMDLYIVTQEGGVWGEPINLGKKINTDKNEIFPFLHADHSLFFSSDGWDGEGGLDIFYTVLDQNQKYARPVNVGTPFNSLADDLGIILDRDKKNGYFSSNREGGKGEDDVYGFNVNDGNIDEYFYFQHRTPDVLEEIIIDVHDQETNAPVSGMDVTFLPLNDPSITRSMLGRNSAGKLILLPQTDSVDNYQIVLDRMNTKGRIASTDSTGHLSIFLPKGYYTSFAQKDNFSDKIAVISTADKQLAITPKFSIGCIPVRGKVVSNTDQVGLPNTLVKMFDENNQLITSSMTDDAGQFDACAKCGQIYRFSVQMNGTDIGESSLDTKGTPCENANALSILIPAGELAVALGEGSIIELKNLYFNFNDPSIRPNAREELDKLVKILNKYPDMEIEVASYTDAVGSNDYNLNISQRRADNVVAYLTKKGIASDRLLAIGYGESGIRNHCKNGVKCSDREHQYNRRIEIKVTKSSIPVKVTYNDQPIDVPSNSGPIHTNTSPSEDMSEYQTFHVVIGAFLMAQNADRKARQAQKVGFEETSVTTFADTPAYHSVIVKTFSDYDEALKFAKMLKRKHKFKYYIKKVK